MSRQVMSRTGKLPQIDAVVFDLDGLMLNTEEIFNDAGRVLMQRRGLVMTDELLCKMMGRRAHEAFGALVDATGITDPIPDLIAEAWQLFEDLMEDRLDTMPGLFRLLDEIDKKQLPKAVATSSGRKYLERMLGQFDLLPRFNTTLTAEDVEHGKPHPEIYIKAAERLAVPVDRTLVLEDSHTGSTAGVRAGAVVVSIPHRHSRSQDFSHVWHVAERLDEPTILTLFE